MAFILMDAFGDLPPPHECLKVQIVPHPTNTVMHNMTMFHSMTDHIYSSGPMRLKGAEKIPTA